VTHTHTGGRKIRSEGRVYQIPSDKLSGKSDFPTKRAEKYTHYEEESRNGGEWVKEVYRFYTQD